jgi:hypothetical protein
MRHYNRSSRANLFTQNFLWIGYHAWQGYLNLDRGVVVISSQVDLFDDSDCHWEDSREPSLNFRYIPRSQLSLYLQEWLVSERSIDPVLTALANYQPQTELIFAMESGPNLDIGWCQHLKTSPPDCHQQICRRWSEFELGIRY